MLKGAKYHLVFTNRCQIVRTLVVGVGFVVCRYKVFKSSARAERICGVRNFCASFSIHLL
jgi:hypothetical protein